MKSIICVLLIVPILIFFSCFKRKENYIYGSAEVTIDGKSYKNKLSDCYCSLSNNSLFIVLSTIQFSGIVVEIKENKGLHELMVLWENDYDKNQIKVPLSSKEFNINYKYKNDSLYVTGDIDLITRQTKLDIYNEILNINGSFKCNLSNNEIK